MSISTAIVVALAVALPATVTRARAAETSNPFDDLAAAELARLDAAGGRPEAIAPLLALFDLAAAEPPGRFDEHVRHLVERAGADPLVAARAREWLARRAEATGDDAGAVALRQPLGLLTRLWVIGPFGDGRASHGVAFPPEAEVGAPQPGRSYPGKERDVAWRRAEGAMRRGALHVDALLRPESDAAAYVLAFVRSPRATDAALRLGSPGPIKVWCNGALAHAGDQVRTARFDQDAVGIRLRAGWNRVVVKTVVTDGSWRLFARLTAPGGGALTFENDWAPPAAAPAPPEPVAKTDKSATRAGGPPPARVAVRALEPLLRERARRAGVPAAAAALAWLDLGRYLLDVDPADHDRKAAAQAFEAAAKRVPSVAAFLGLSAAGREDDERRRALERALAVSATPLDRARVLAALGDVARDQHRDAWALDRWRAAVAADPRWWPAVLSLASEEQMAGLPAAALGRIDALPAAVRAVPVVARARARALIALDRRTDAEAVLRSLLPGARDDADLARDLAGYAWDKGDGPESIRLLAKAAELRPDIPSLTVDWARALEGEGWGPKGNGDGDADAGGDGPAAAARAALEAAARRLPDEFTLAAELGKLVDRHDAAGVPAAGDLAGAGGASAEALTWLRRALALRPQDQELRRYTEAAAARETSGELGRRNRGRPHPGDAAHLAGRSELARRFATDVAAWMATPVAAPASAPPKPSPSPSTIPSTPAPAPSPTSSAASAAEPDAAVVLIDRRVVRVHQNGLSESFSQRVLEVRTDAGARDNKEFLVRYTPGSEEVEILEARIFRRDAAGHPQIVQASERDDQDLSEPWYGLYYDYRAEVVRFEGLRAGDVVEIQYLVSDVSAENQLAGYFGDIQFLAEGVPKRRWDYTLIHPRGRTFHFARPAIAGLEEGTRTEGDEDVVWFTAHDIPRVEAEPAMPGIAEVSPYLHVSTYASWDEVGAWYWRLVEEQLVADDTVHRAALDAITAALSGHGSRGLSEREREREKVRALHGLVVGGTRYVGLEFGIHGFKPYKVSQVLARKFGDCKDKASLLVSVLREAGIGAELVLLRTRRGGRVGELPASLAVFDHAIAYVPSLDLYLDGTAEFSGMEELPGQDQGVMVLRIGPYGSHLATTPVLPSSRNRASRVWQVALRADGGADVDETLTLTGQAAPEWREHYQTPGERQERYGKAWTQRHPGARLASVEMPGIEDRNHPIVVHARADVPGLAEPGPRGGLRLGLGSHDAELVRTYARLSERRSDLVLAFPWQQDETMIYRLPAGFAAATLPAQRQIVSRFGHFDLQVTRPEPGVVKVVGRLDVADDRIAPADYRDFRRFLADVDAALAERITLAPGAEGPRAAGEKGAAAR